MSGGRVDKGRPRKFYAEHRICGILKRANYRLPKPTSLHEKADECQLLPLVFNSETRSDAEPQPGPSKRLRTE
ncbi:hypothetical protein EVAR_25150_1 [Eumeta japonica]|uniref:Uncharacterized protein n=1 Tax=Eumeta variegata TaxID=151549 RepID=A0A4C1VSG4_EUMVA|nr:hypothetical protein EVAR_25150_1 [Eumeta japonica]